MAVKKAAEYCAPHKTLRYPLENCRRDGGATIANRHYILQTLVRTAGRKGLRYRRTGNHGRKETGAGVATRRLNTTP